MLKKFVPHALNGSFVLLLFAYLWKSAGRFPMDFDELALTHVVWSMSKGLRPYMDFYEAHTPFFGFAVAPLFTFLPDRFESLIILRRILLIFSVTSVGFLIISVQNQFEKLKEKILVLLAVTIVVMQPTVIQALCEFRIDHLSRFLVFLGLLIISFQSRPATSVAQSALIGFIFTLGIAIDGKLFLIPVAATIFMGIENFQNKTFLSFAAGLSSGIAAALLIALGLLLTYRIDIQRMYSLVFSYQTKMLTQTFGWGQSLGAELIKHAGRQYGVLAILWGLMLAALIYDLKNGGWARHKIAYSLALHAFLQPLLVRSPFKQYIYSIYLAQLGALSLFLFWSFQTKLKNAVLILFGVLLAISLYFENARYRQIMSNDTILNQIQLGDVLLHAVPTNKSVATELPFHPLFRRDATYGWSDAAIVNGQPMEDLLSAFGDLRDHFSDDGYTSELEKNAPWLIIIKQDRNVKRYRIALINYADRHRSDYDAYTNPHFTMLVRKP